MPSGLSNKFEVEDTAGNVEVYEESEADRIGTFPNENNPTSVAAVVKDLPNEFGTYPETVQKIGACQAKNRRFHIFQSRHFKEPLMV